LIGKLFDRFIEWSLNRQDQYLSQKKIKAPVRKRTSRVRRRANARKKK